jgi:hypothetical protein
MAVIRAAGLLFWAGDTLNFAWTENLVWTCKAFRAASEPRLSASDRQIAGLADRSDATDTD